MLKLLELVLKDLCLDCFLVVVFVLELLHNMELWRVLFLRKQKALFLWPLDLVVCHEHYLVLLFEYLDQVVFELLHNIELWLVWVVSRG